MSGKKKSHKISANRIEITIEGDDGASNDVTLAAFYQQLQRIHRLLTKIETRQSGSKATTKFTVVDLSHSSPARVVIEARAPVKKVDRAVAVMRGFNDAWYAAYTGTSLDTVDDEILEDMRDIANPVGKQIHSLVIGTEKDHYDITEKIAKRIEVELATAEIEYGTAEGTLEQINIHEGQNFFHIYYAGGNGKLKCRFPTKLIDDATSAIGRKVSVTGQMHYRAKTLCPFEIHVEDIELFPLESELPEFDDIRGLAPDITDGKSSEAYISEMRDAWD